jgi:hypothetical protein
MEMVKELEREQVLVLKDYIQIHRHQEDFLQHHHPQILQDCQ